MARFPNSLAFIMLLLAVSGSWAAVARSHHQKACSSCREPAASSKVPRDQAVDVSTTVLAMGEPCGVYTLSCAKGLRCMPPPQENSPLQALLQGRGLCTKAGRNNNTERPQPPDAKPPHHGELEKAPCRRLLNALVQGLELTIFSSNSDIYIPNCDTRGYYRKKQCRSSMGMQRGHCWCVDEHGTVMPGRADEDGNLPCDDQ